MRLALAIIAILLPGVAFWAWFNNKKNDPAENLAQILGVSFSVITIAALLFYLLPIKANAWITGFFLGLCLALTVIGFLKNKRKFVVSQWIWVLLVFGAMIFWRILQAQPLALPNWVDSQHHVLIVRKIIESGGIPGSLEPYLPGPFYYHFSFHSIAAFFSSISGLNPAQSTLLLGQLVNACIGLGIYALTKSISKDWRPALVAALFVSFVTKMPGYYMTWGRYTLLTGTYLLAVAMAVALKIREGQTDLGNKLTLGLLTAGALLSHYLIAFLLAFYLIILGIDWIIKNLKTKKWDFKPFLSMLIPSLSGLIVSAPWYLRVLKYSTGRYSIGVDTTNANFLPKAEDWGYVKYVLGPVSGYLLIAIALIALVFAFIKSEYRKFAIWSLFIILMTVPTGIQFMSFRGDYFSLITFIPITILSALGLHWFAEQAEKWTKVKNLGMILLAVMVIPITIWGAKQTLHAINRTTIVGTKDDVEALDWVNTHLPEDARFYVNTVSWGFGIYRGIDGGAWLLPYTGRFSIAPTTFFPYGLDSKTNEEWMSWGARASTITQCNQDFYKLIEDTNLTHIYVRDGVKPNAQENVAGIQSQTLLTCKGVKQLYQNASVSIWEIER